MHIILGASGQVGSAVADSLIKQGDPVIGIIRNPDDAHALAEKGVTVGFGDIFDLESLENIFSKGETVFIITPESGKSEDVMRDTRLGLANVVGAIKQSPIKKIVGLSSIGAHLKEHSGNLYMSYLLEHAFEDLPQQKIFIRPAYYYSNWMAYVESAKESGILPTFYPPDLKLSMISPLDVAGFAAKIIHDDIEGNPVYELLGPEFLSSADVALAMGEVLGKKITAQQIPEKKWRETLEHIGFTADATKNFLEMMQTVIDGNTQPEGNGTIEAHGETKIGDYFRAMIK